MKSIVTDQRQVNPFKFKIAQHFILLFVCIGMFFCSSKNSDVEQSSDSAENSSDLSDNSKKSDSTDEDSDSEGTDSNTNDESDSEEPTDDDDKIDPQLPYSADIKEGTIVTDSSLFSDAQTAFSIVILPDTQDYAAYKPLIYTDQTQWIIDNKDEFNIKLVLHLGDVVASESNIEQWESSRASMDLLWNPDSQEGVPYGIAYGNHDMRVEDGQVLTPRFEQFFPLSLFESMPLFGGAFENDNAHNTWFSFSEAGLNMLIFFLEFGPRNDVLNWALGIANEHPEHIVAVATHAYLNEEDMILGSPGAENKSPLNGYGLDRSSSNDGMGIFEKLIYPASNIHFVFSGHVGTSEDGAGNLVSANSEGLYVYQMLSNWQYFYWGDSGYLRLLEFKPADKVVRVSTYAPSFDMSLTDADNQFEIVDETLFP